MKLNILSEIKKLGITKVEWLYDGREGNGSVNEVLFTPQPPAETISDELYMEIVDYAKEEVDGRFPGWDDGDGAFGEVVLNVATGSMIVYHNERIVSLHSLMDKWNVTEAFFDEAIADDADDVEYIGDMQKPELSFVDQLSAALNKGGSA